MILLALVDYILEQGASIMLIQEQRLSLFVPLRDDSLTYCLFANGN